jgi:uncharacterized protein YbbC (DUF1343 family)
MGMDERGVRTARDGGDTVAAQVELLQGLEVVELYEGRKRAQ